MLQFDTTGTVGHSSAGGNFSVSFQQLSVKHYSRYMQNEWATAAWEKLSTDWAAAGHTVSLCHRYWQAFVGQFVFFGQYIIYLMFYPRGYPTEPIMGSGQVVGLHIRVASMLTLNFPPLILTRALASEREVCMRYAARGS